MKKIILVATLLVAGFTNAQETTQGDFKENISAIGSIGENLQVGISYESKSWLQPEKKNASTVVNLFWQSGVMEFSNNSDVKGNGWHADIAFRSYMSKTKGNKGFYYSNGFSSGNLTFDKKDVYDGKYRYISFLTPEIGYKLSAGPINIEPFLGTMWKIEIKGKGDVDNKDFDNWNTRVGLKIGYQF